MTRDSVDDRLWKVDMREKNRLLWLPSVVGRLCAYLSTLSLLFVLLFLVGNLQDFLDSTQILLLHLFDISCVVFVVACLYYIGVLIALSIREHRVRILRLALAIVGVLVFTALYAAVRFLLAWVS